MERYRSCVEIIKKVDPALVVADPSINYGLDACSKLGRKHTILSPLPYFVTILAEQPNGAPLWKYPAPVALDPSNVYLCLRLFWGFILSPRVKMLNQVRAQEGLQDPLPMFNAYRKDRLHFLPALPELDFPFLSGVAPSFYPLSDGGAGPIVVVNLGTHFLFDASQARALATGLKAVLERKPDLQVLWKLKSAAGGSVFTDHEEVLGEENKAERVRIEKWLKPDPIVILQHENVVCSCIMAVRIHSMKRASTFLPP
ncbi:hypothetical protein VTN00DRAFT_3680 [Thermoascus crustaceus]|uniref:uncharacterized protein n=1 Tax=Thermoascus crustaceus TaxID=5088 RepID=UPI0037429E4C